MRIVFWGATELGFDCCQHLIEKGFNIVGVFTIPQKFDIKYKNQESKKVKNYLFKDFKFFHEKYNIPVFEVNQNINEYWTSYTDLKPDFCIMIGWYYNIPNKFLKAPNKGFGAIHASLLPKYRGNAPIVWAMINGESETGITFFELNGEVDTGDIFAQQKIKIDDNDKIYDLLEKVKLESKIILSNTLPLIEENKIIKIKQDISEEPYYPKRSPEDGLINWNQDSKEIKNFIRAQSKPYPGAYTIINGKKIIIWDADIYNIDELTS